MPLSKHDTTCLGITAFRPLPDRLFRSADLSRHPRRAEAQSKLTDVRPIFGGCFGGRYTCKGQSTHTNHMSLKLIPSPRGSRSQVGRCVASSTRVGLAKCVAVSGFREPPISQRLPALRNLCPRPQLGSVEHTVEVLAGPQCCGTVRGCKDLRRVN
ncbi:hypothetical protein K438DRAFT_1791796 [Mycena galopus ATCC 62051]|nr:hypothetical protein K438DRAFT_1791796 [Mycena galopus ATCC 62051]